MEQMKPYLDKYEAEARKKQKRSKLYREVMANKAVDALEAVNKKNKFLSNVARTGIPSEDITGDIAQPPQVDNVKNTALEEEVGTIKPYKFLLTPSNIASELGKVTLGAADSVVTDLGNTVIDFTNYLADTKISHLDTKLREPDTGFGKVTKEMLEFVIKFLPVSRALQGTQAISKLANLGKAGQVATYVATDMFVGGLSDFVNDPDEGNFTTAIVDIMPEADAYLPDYFEHKIDDGELEKRLKNTLEGAALGVGVDTLITIVKGISKTAKAIKNSKVASEFGVKLKKGFFKDDTLKNVKEALDNDLNLDEVLQESNDTTKIKEIAERLKARYETPEEMAQAFDEAAQRDVPTQLDTVMREADETMGEQTIAQADEVVKRRGVEDIPTFSQRGSGGKVVKEPSYFESPKRAIDKDYRFFHTKESLSKMKRRTAILDDMVDEYATEEFDAFKRLVVKNSADTVGSMKRTIKRIKPNLDDLELDRQVKLIYQDRAAIAARDELLGEPIGETIMRSAGMTESDIRIVSEDLRVKNAINKKEDLMSLLADQPESVKKEISNTFDKLYPEGAKDYVQGTSRVMAHPSTILGPILGGTWGNSHDLDGDGEIGSTGDIVIGALLGTGIAMTAGPAFKGIKNYWKKARNASVARLEKTRLAMKEAYAKEVQLKKATLKADLDAEVAEKIAREVEVLQEGIRELDSISSIQDYMTKIKNNKLRTDLEKLFVPPVEIDESVMNKLTDDIISGNVDEASKAVKLKFANISSGNDINSIINTVQNVIESSIEGSKKVIPQEVTEKVSKKLLNKHSGVKLINDLHRDLLSNRSTARLHAANIVLDNMHTEIKSAASEITEASDTKTLLDFTHKLSTYLSTQKLVGEVRSEAGRMLNILKKTARGLDAGISSAEAQYILKNAGDKASVLKVAKAIANATEKEADNIVKLVGMTGLDKFGRARRFALLFNAPTHLKNTIGGALMTARHIGATALTSPRKAAHQITTLFEALKDSFILAGDVFTDEGLERATAQGTKFGTGTTGSVSEIAEAAKTLKTGEIFGAKEGRNKVWAGITSGLDMLSTWNTKAMAAEDEFFYNINMRLNMSDKAFELAESAVGNAKGAQADEIFTNTYASLMNSPTQDMYYKATEFAKYQTFRNELAPLNQKVYNLLNDKSVIMRLISSIIIPFSKTPINILRDSLAFSFGGATKLPKVGKALDKILPNFDNLVKGGIITEKQANGLMGLGAGLITMGFLGNMAGVIRGGEGPYESQTRRARYSIDLGDWNASFDGLEPIGFPLGLGASLAEITFKSIKDIKEDPNISGPMKIPEGVLHILGGGMAVTGSFLLDKSYLAGVSDTMLMFNQSENRSALGAIKAYGKSLARSFVPGVVGNVEDIFTPGMVEMYDTLDAIGAKIPGASLALERRLDIYGEPLATRRATLTPMSIARIRDDKFLEALDEADVDMNRRFKNFKSLYGIKLNAKQYTKIRQLYGNFLKENKGSIMQLYNRFKDNKKIQEQLLDDYLSKAGAYAKGKFLSTEPELVTKIKQQRLIQAGVGQ